MSSLRFLEHTDIPLDQIIDDLGDMRVVRDAMSDEELTASIRAIGVQDPIQVRPHLKQDKFQLVDGRRRFRSSSDAGKTTIPADIWEMTDLEAYNVALVRNIHRDDPDPVGLGFWLSKIRDTDPGIKTQEDLSKVVNKSQGWVSRQLSAYNQALDAMKAVEGKIDEKSLDIEALQNSMPTERHARALRQAGDAVKERVLELTNFIGEPPSARQIEKMMKANYIPQEILEKYDPKSTQYDDAFIVYELIEKAGMSVLAGQKMVDAWRKSQLDWQRSQKTSNIKILGDKDVIMYKQLSELYPVELIDLVDEVAPAKTLETMKRYCRRLIRKLLQKADQKLIQTALEDFKEG